MRVPSLDRVTAVLAPLVTVLVTFLVIVVTLLVVRPPVPSSAQGVPPDAGVRREVRIGAPGVPSVLDPGAALEGTVPLIARQVFDTLVVWREGSTEIDPALATRWTASRDGLVWSFTLREGVKFHDGTPLTSTEVAASFERQLQPETQGAGRAWPALLRGAPGVVKEFPTAPTDSFVPPSDAEFFIMGRTENPDSGLTPFPGGGLSGRYGHIIR